jgi:multiple sugar transport system substrate-binding protein
MWAFGREGEVVSQLLPEFTRRNPGLRVEVQQIPWTAAHEKLLTAFVGRALPDLSPIGNSWVAEFEAIGALEPLQRRAERSAVISGADDFPGIWRTNVIDGVLYGIPWYVDTRVLFYRRDLLAAAGRPDPVTTWSEWRNAMRRVRTSTGGRTFGALLPTDEWAEPMILGLQRGASLLNAAGTRGAFREAAFTEAAEFYVGLFREGLAPTLANTQVANVYQQFANGDFAMYPTGPWNIGEFRRRLPISVQDRWATMPMPASGAGTDAGTSRTPGVSLAGGSSLVVFRGSARKDDAWKLVEYLSEPAQQSLFYRLVGDLPARRSAWADPALSADPAAAAFRVQLDHLARTPLVPEWEQICTRVWEHLEPAIRGKIPVATALAELDSDVDQILAKRRWMLERGRADRSGRMLGAMTSARGMEWRQ